MTKIEDPLRHLLVLIRSNFVVLVVTAVIVLAIDYKDFFGRDSDEVYYLAISSVVIFLLLLTLQKYRNPLHYWPRYVFFVKDRNDSQIKMEPYLDPWLIWLGLIRPMELVNVRYSMYPDLDVGVDIDPNTGVITGFPMELGNHTSEIKMRFLGGAYSTTVRIEVTDSLRTKSVLSEEQFAPPRSVAQLLVREEDLSKKESEIHTKWDEKEAELEEMYRSKMAALDKEFKKDKKNISKTYDKKLKLKQEKLEKLEVEMVEALQDKEREFVEFERDMKKKLKASEKKADELEQKLEPWRDRAKKD